MQAYCKIEEFFFELLNDSLNRPKINRLAVTFSTSEWEDFFFIISRSGLFPICSYRLLQIKELRVPSFYKDRLKQIYFLNLLRMTNLVRELQDILVEFYQQNVEAIPLKGPFLAYFLYGDIGLRRASSDLDILVKKDKFHIAEKILLKKGYSPQVKENSLRSFKFAYDQQLLYSRFISANESYIVELHFGLRNREIDSLTQDCFDGSILVNFGEKKIKFLSLENLVFYLSLLCLTITELPELRYFFDLHTLISRYSNRIYWEKLYRMIPKHHKKVVYRALSISKELFNTPVPGEFLFRLKPRFLDNNFFKFFLNKRQVLTNVYLKDRYYYFTFWHYFVSSLLYARNFADSLKIIFRKIFPSAENIQFYYNREGANISLPFLYLRRIIQPLVHLWWSMS